MGLTHATPPDGHKTLLRDKLDELHPAPSKFESWGDSRRLFKIGDALPVYGIDKDELAAGRFLDAAKLIAWRSVVDHGGGKLEAVDLHEPSEPGGSLAFGGANEGPFVKALQQGCEAAAALPQVEACDYELRLFNGTPVSFLTLWLHPVGDGADLLLPLHDAGALKAFAVASSESVQAYLQAEAQPASGPGWDELG